MSLSNYKLEFGMQYVQPINLKDDLTIGAVFSPGHSLNADPTCSIITKNSSITKSDTTSYVVIDGLELPTTFGLGLAYQHDQKLRIGADFQMQKWGAVDFPAFEKDTYRLKSGMLKDSYKLNVGAGYSTPYYYINGQDGPKDLHLSLGVGIPIMNSYNNRSILNISAQWQHRSADNLITENTFRLNIGLTFNERWFAKWKVD